MTRTRAGKCGMSVEIARREIGERPLREAQEMLKDLQFGMQDWMLFAHEQVFRRQMHSERHSQPGKRDEVNSKRRTVEDHQGRRRGMEPVSSQHGFAIPPSS